MELDIIRGIQSIRSGFLDAVMQILTELGDQYIFILVAAVFYWIINKKFAFRLTFIFLFSAMIVELIKGIVARPRPYSVDPSVGVGSETGGYSFPSGHAQNIASMTTTIYLGYYRRYKWLKWVLLGVALLVGFTRIYLGQHYLTDVIVGLILGVLVTLAIYKLIDLMGDREHVYGLYTTIPLVLFLLILSLFPQTYESVKNIYVAVGGFVGFMGGYYLEKRYINHQPETINALHKLYRMLIGLAGVLILYLGLSFLFDAIMVDNQYFDAIRYALIGLWASLGAMSTYKKLGI